MRQFILFFCIASLTLNPLGRAEETAPAVIEKKSLFWIPTLSVILPGLGQGIDGENAKSVLLGGLGFSGILIAADGYRKEQNYLNGTGPADYNYYEDTQLQQRAGNSMYINAGFLSGWDNFNHRVKAYQAEGKFQFLPKEQSVSDLLKAPFHFSYMTRPTTWIPFLLSMGLSYDYLINGDDRPDKIHYRGSDLATGLYLSYNAGTGEEAYFRGVLYPTLYEAWHGSLWANFAQGLIFGFAHGPAPYPQIISGWYLGWLAERNGFDLGESIFVHAWWDVWLITASLILNRSNANSDLYIQLPAFSMRF